MNKFIALVLLCIFARGAPAETAKMNYFETSFFPVLPAGCEMMKPEMNTTLQAQYVPVSSIALHRFDDAISQKTSSITGFVDYSTCPYPALGYASRLTRNTWDDVEFNQRE